MKTSLRAASRAHGKTTLLAASGCAELYSPLRRRIPECVPLRSSRCGRSLREPDSRAIVDPSTRPSDMSKCWLVQGQTNNKNKKNKKHKQNKKNRTNNTNRKNRNNMLSRKSKKKT